MSKINDLMVELILEASKTPEVSSTATAMFAKTVAWAEEMGIMASTTKTKKVNPLLALMATTMDNAYNEGGSFNTTQWIVLKRFFETALDGEIPTKRLPSDTSNSHAPFPSGIAIKMIANKHQHSYPLGAVIFVDNGDEICGVLENGTAPSAGVYFDPEPSSITIPTEPEILAGLARMSVVNPPKFQQFVELVK